VLVGFVIGIASVTPGLSGGVIAAAAGLYEPAIHAILNLRKEFRASVYYLAPLAIGAGSGIFLFSKVMKELMTKAESAVLYVFLGLVAGSLPSLVKEANSGGFKKRYLWATVIPFAVVFFLDALMGQAKNPNTPVELGILDTILYGAVLAVGTIVPGISSSFILMYLGVYEKLLSAIANMELKILFMLAVGFAVAGLLMIKLVEFLFRRFRAFAYYAVLGFLLASMVMVFPGLRQGWGMALDAFLFLASGIASYSVMCLDRRGTD